MKVISASATKIRENATNIWKLLCFTVNLHFVTTNQIFTDRKLNLPLISSIYFVFLPLGIQRRPEQTKLYHAFSYFVWKETTHNPLKVASAKALFSSVYIIGAACFDECFLFYVITGRHYFLWKTDVDCHVAAFFEASVLKKSVIYVFSPQ